MAHRGRGGSGRGGRGGRGGGAEGPWTTLFRGGGRGSARGRGGAAAGYSHDDTRHVLKSDNLKKNRGKGKGKGKGEGKGKGRNDGVCFDFQRNGTCPRGEECRWRHVFQGASPVERVEEDSIARHTEVARAHAGTIVAIAMTEQGIYTASQDKCLKRWKPTKGADGRFELAPEVQIPLQEACFSLFCGGGWLFCGLWDGSIIGYSQDGANVTLKGHTKRVTAIREHQGVLISGSADREVRLWQLDPGTKEFKCTHTISESMPGSISCLQVLGEHLFVGGMSGIAMCNLARLEVSRLLPPQRSVVAFLEFQGHAIAGYGDGSIRIWDAEGNLKSDVKPMAAGPILSLAGLESGPRVLVGHSRGQVSTIALPDFTFKASFQAFADGGVESIMCPGHDGLFLLGSKSGALQLWQRIGP